MRPFLPIFMGGFRIILRAGFIFIVLGLCGLEGVNGAVIGDVTANGDGSFTYRYRVDNGAGLLSSVAAWSLELGIREGDWDWDPLDIFSGGDVAVPSPFWVSLPGIPVASASALDFLSLSTAGDVLAGQVSGEFSFRSFYGPGGVDYFEFDPLGGALPGRTIGPVIPTVPEVEVSAIGLVLVLMGVAFRVHWIRRGEGVGR